jgi:hypothetical protein
VYPNPAAGQATVELTGFQKTATLTVLNALGQVVQQQALNSTAAPVALNLAKLAKGVYLLRVTNADVTLTQRLVRE